MDFSDTTQKEIYCKAAVLWGFQKPYSVEKILVKTPGPKEVRIKMVATGLCHSDLSVADGFLSMQPLPFVGGHEGAGIVESVGEWVTSVSPGDKVLTSFFPQCRKCAPCQSARTNMCQDIGRYSKPPVPFLRELGYDGQYKFTCNGQNLYNLSGCSALSEYTVIPENSCVKININAPLDKVCIIACGFSTGYGSATKSVSIGLGETVAVWGLGGVGLAAVIGCREKGASKIIGIDTNSNKEGIAKKFGCTDFVYMTNSESQKPVAEIIRGITGGGVDFAIVCVGNAKAMEEAIYTTNDGGTTVLVGVPSVQDTISVSPAFLLGSRKIVGTLFGDYKVLDDLPKVVNHYMNGNLPQIDDFISGTIALEEINEGLKLMRTGESIRTIVLF